MIVIIVMVAEYPLIIKNLVLGDYHRFLTGDIYYPKLLKVNQI